MLVICVRPGKRENAGKHPYSHAKSCIIVCSLYKYQFSLRRLIYVLPTMLIRVYIVQQLSNLIPCLLEYQASMGGKEWCEHEGLDGHELDQDVEGRPGRVLERIADGVADHGGLVSVRPLGA